MAEVHLSIQNIKKSFGGIFALSDVTFDIHKGECLALVGENGAGKSTLMKILSGVWPDGSFEGQVFFEGKPLKLKSSIEGRKSGISIIHQELCLFPKLTVAENLFLTEEYPFLGKPSQKLFEKIHWKAMEEKAKALFESLGFDVDPKALIEDLSVAKRQLVEIARAFQNQASLIILDEPTSALSQWEVVHLFNVIKRLKGKTTFIYISHKLEEVFELCDRIVVLRDGKAVSTLTAATTQPNEVIRQMVGRPFNVGVRQKRETQNEIPILKIENLSHFSEQGKQIISEVSFEAYSGEVIGIAGLMGAGRSELLRSVLGLLPGKKIGKVILNNKEVVFENMNDAIEKGVSFLPEDRKKDGLFLNHSIAFNLSISVLKSFLSPFRMLMLEKESEKAKDQATKMRVKYSDLESPVKSLSGGNQQKVLLAKVMANEPRVLFLDEPTRGIDVGAKEEIYEIIRGLAISGLCVVFVSSELPEVLMLSDRVIVLREGRKVADLINEGLTQEKVMTYAAGEANGVN